MTNKKKIRSIIAIIGMLSLNAVAGEIEEKDFYFYGNHTIEDVLYKGKSPRDYFDVLECGSYHCYGQKGSHLYVTGFNGQGQLGIGDQLSLKNWQLGLKKIKYFKMYDFGGCVRTESDEYFETGNVRNKNSFGTFKISKEWKKVENCH